MTRVRNLVVFGDSLSDIGIMANSTLGKMAGNAITTSPTGRFSDCRNWTDFMDEQASGGGSLIKGNPTDSKVASKKHHSLTADSLVTVANDRNFYYANYAVGGATGGIPSWNGKAKCCTQTMVKSREKTQCRLDFHGPRRELTRKARTRSGRDMNRHERYDRDFAALGLWGLSRLKVVG